jgi:lipopolysaccharide/colanic/teichoic acid biosynthesis glycosyltransferase
MSLVGPRPEVPAYVDCGDPTWDRVLSVRPGMTDLSTLVFRNEEEVLARSADPETFYRTVLLPEKLRLALRYHQARSVLSDVRLLTATIRLSLQPSNSDADSIKKKFLN